MSKNNAKSLQRICLENDINGLQDKVKRATSITIVTTNTNATSRCHRLKLSYAQRYDIKYNNIAFNEYKSKYCCTTNCTITVVIIVLS